VMNGPVLRLGILVMAVGVGVVVMMSVCSEAVNVLVGLLSGLQKHFVQSTRGSSHIYKKDPW
jgi:hypothetical protein